MKRAKGVATEGVVKSVSWLSVGTVVAGKSATRVGVLHAAPGSAGVDFTAIRGLGCAQAAGRTIRISSRMPPDRVAVTGGASSTLCSVVGAKAAYHV